MRTTGLEFAARGELAVVDLGEPPALGPTQVLIETRFTGVTNGTERHAFLGEHGYGGGRYPSRHGYQHVGVIVATGDAATRYQVGDWVFFGQYVGHRGWNVVDENDLMIALPETVDRRQCALFGVAGVAMRAVRRMRVAPGDNVWVAGQGPIGHFIGQAARCAGARVIVTDLLARRLEAARACGAHVVLDASDQATIDALSDGGPYDYIYDACSAERLLFYIHQHRLLKHGGTIGCIAVRDTLTFPWSVLHGTEAKIEVSCHFGPDDLAALLFLVEQGQIRIEPVVSHIAPIDDAPRIYGLLADRAPDLLGAILDWT